MNQPPSALRSALALAGFILVTFCAPLAGMFSLPGAWYAARWIAILLALVSFHRVHKTAGLLFAPCLAWVTFAALLNFTLWRMNPAGDNSHPGGIFAAINTRKAVQVNTFRLTRQPPGCTHIRRAQAAHRLVRRLRFLLRVGRTTP